MKRPLSLSFLFLFLLIIPPTAQAQTPLWSGIIDPSRAVDWTPAGVGGGIPIRNTICTTLGLAGQAPTYVQGVTYSQINTALSGCPSGEVVFINPGTYNLSGSIFMVSHVTLRGAGGDQTLLEFSSQGGADVIFEGDNTWTGASQAQPGGSQAANWTAGYTQGTTSITLNNIGSSGIKVGQYIYLDQANLTAPSGNFWMCDNATTPCSLQGGNGARVVRGASQSQMQIVKVTACSPSCTNGSTFTISPGLYGPNWNNAQYKGAWWAATQLQYAGLENLSVDDTPDTGNTGGNNISIYNSFDCWVTGIRSINAARSHIQYSEAAHNSVQNNYLYGNKGATSQSYGVEAYFSSDNLTVNNITQRVTSPFMTQLASGSVNAYNFDILDYYCDQTACNDSAGGYLGVTTLMHNAGIMYVLWEGNITSGYKGDSLHGNGGMETIFRSYVAGSMPHINSANTGRSMNAIELTAYNRAYNIIGNVLGTAGETTLYTGGNGYGQADVYSLGGGNVQNITIPNDPGVAITAMRWGNYDVVSAAVRWCGNSSDPGWSTTCASTSEVPTGIGGYANAVPSSTTLPVSLYYSSTPSWWPAGKPWPLIGPDVSGGNMSGYAGHANTNPADDCYTNVMRGPSDGTGPVLTFNANTCYETSTTTSAPAPPTSLTAVVQ